jgi:hypothetical protein
VVAIVQMRRQPNVFHIDNIDRVNCESAGTVRVNRGYTLESPRTSEVEKPEIITDDVSKLVSTLEGPEQSVQNQQANKQAQEAIG